LPNVLQGRLAQQRIDHRAGGGAVIGATAAGAAIQAELRFGAATEA